MIQRDGILYVSECNDNRNRETLCAGFQPCAALSGSRRYKLEEWERLWAVSPPMKSEETIKCSRRGTSGGFFMQTTADWWDGAGHIYTQK